MNIWLFRFINDTIKNPVLDRWLPIFSDKDYVILPGLMVLGVVMYCGNRRARLCVLALLIAVAVADIGAVRVIKNIVRAERPYAAVEGVHLHRGGDWMDYDPVLYPFDPRKSYSFPSAHAANVAAVAAVLAFLHRRTLWGMVPLAMLVGLSRVYTGNHYPLDVLGGYIWGIASGVGACLLVNECAARFVPAAPTEPAPRAVPLERRLFCALLAVWLVGNFLFLHLNLFDLAGDEAQYWDWSRRPALGYYSKPPMIAYVFRVLTSAGGHREWAIRSGAVIFSGATLALVHALTLRITRNERAALLAAAAAAAMPVSWAGSVLMTIDPLLVFFWALALVAFHRAAMEDGDGIWWVLTGLAVGLGTLSKYTMALILASFALYLLAYDRRWLARKEPYIALAAAFLCLSGVVYWNATHNWVSVRHTAQIGATDSFSVFDSARNLGEFAAGQVGVVSPILFGFFFWAGWRCLLRFTEDRNAGFLALASDVPLVFYAVVSVARRPEANWPVAGYVGACVALGWAWSQQPLGRVARHILIAGLVLGCLIGLFARSTDLLYGLGSAPEPGQPDDRLRVAGLVIDPNKDPTIRLRGGRELGAALSKYVGNKITGPFFFSDRYQLTAWIAFYTSGRPRAYCLPFNRRQNQYDIWGGWSQLAGRDGIFVCGGDAARAQRWIDGMVGAGLFDRGEVLETVNVRRGHTVIKSLTISRLYNFSGQDLKPGEIY